MTIETAADLGTLIQRAVLPTSAGMDAIEARLVLVQEVPPKQEVRFYAIRGEHCEQLTSDAAVSILRAHVPQKPVDDLSAADMMVEISVLRAEMDRLRPVYEAAKTWRTHTRSWLASARSWLADATVDEALARAVDAAVAANGIARTETSS